MTIEDYFEERRRILIELRVQGVGEVGIFWLLPGKNMLVSSVPVDLGERYADFVILAQPHESHWRFLQPHAPALQGREYDEVPRGRVSFNVPTGKFHILSSKALLADADAVAKVVGAFRLGGHCYLLVPDSHYEIRRR